MTEATLLAVSVTQLESRAVAAVRSSADRLGHSCGCAFLTLEDFGESVRSLIGETASAALAPCDEAVLRHVVYALDPWAVVALDAPSVQALGTAFGERVGEFGADSPVEVDGYTLVAVPDFAACLDDADAKAVAWRRLRAAAHPGNPLDVRG